MYRYVYKPCMSKTCCPLYTIRCKAGQYQPTKSQRKVVKKVQNLVSDGSLTIRYFQNTTDTKKRHCLYV